MTNATLEKKPETTPLSLSFIETLQNWLLAFKMKLIKKKIQRPFLDEMKHPKRTQMELLRSILEENKETVLGQKYGFGDIDDYKTFQDAIPVMQYEDVRDFIKNQDREKKPYLTAEMPVMFSQTSGTTGKPKYIPVLKEGLEGFQHQQELSAVVEYQECPEAFEGKIVGIVSPWVEGHLPSGSPYGSISGYIYKNYPKVIQSKYTLPSEISDIKDYELRHYIIARLCLAEENVTLMATATPSTFHEILDVIEKYKKQLIDEIKSGECKGLEELDPKVKTAIEKRLHPNPERAEILSKLLKEEREWGYSDFWPHLKLISTWIGSSSGISFDLLLERLPKNIKIVDLGYISSEFRGTIAMGADTTYGAPTIDQVFFEFVEEKEKGDSKPPYHFKRIHELEKGKDYYIFITTRTGLYRYDMNDIVRVGDKMGETPLLKFVQKGKGFTNITGEKLHESQLIEAMTLAEKEFDLEINFYKALASQRGHHYELYVELKKGDSTDEKKLCQFVDEKLKELNIEYKIKRSGGQLKAMRCHLIKPGTFEKYKLHLVKKGQRESQFKVLLIQHKEDCDFDFGKCVLRKS